MSRFYNTGDTLCDKRNVPKEARNEEEFGYMAGYELWEKLIFDR